MSVLDELKKIGGSIVQSPAAPAGSAASYDQIGKRTGGRKITIPKLINAPYGPADVKGRYLYVDNIVGAGGLGIIIDDSQTFFPNSLIGFRCNFSRLQLTGGGSVWLFSDEDCDPTSGGIPFGNGAAVAIVGGQNTLPVPYAGPVLPVSDIGGVSNPAILDVTTGVGAGLDTGILDISPWRGITTWASYSGAAASAPTLNVVDDAGANIPNGWNPSAPGINGNFVSTSIGAGVPQSGSQNCIPLILPRRIRLVYGAQAGATLRVRIEGRR